MANQAKDIQSLSRILLSYRGTDEDKELLQVVCQIARSHRAQVILLHVVEAPLSHSLDSPDVPGIEEGRVLLDDGRLHARGCGENVSTRLVTAREAGRAIVDFAHTNGCDLIVLDAGKRSVGLSDEGTLGIVLSRAKCEVWVSRAYASGAFWHAEKESV